MQKLLAELDGLGVPIAIELSEDALALSKFHITTLYRNALGGADSRTALLASEPNEAIARAKRVVESAASAVERERRNDGT